MESSLSSGDDSYVNVITIHQVKSLPPAVVSNLIPEFEYTTIFLDYSSLALNMSLFSPPEITFLQSTVLSEGLYVNTNMFL